MSSWVVLYQLLHKVRPSHNASGLVLDVLHAHLPLAPRELHAPLLVLTVYHLSSYRLQVPLQPLVAQFFETPIQLEQLEHAFNFLLRALSASPVRSVPVANNVVLLLAAMNDGHIPLRPSTYRALLNDRFVTPQLTKHLHAKMLKEGIVPTAEHLEAFLRLFAKNGAIHKARRYFVAIHALTKGKEREEGDRDVRLSANMLMLGAHDDKASAFAFLRRLAEFSTPPHSSTSTTSNPTSTTSKTPLTTTSKPFTTSKPPPRFIHPFSPSIYDQTTALHLTATDLSTPTRQLIHLFLTLSAPPTVATYTVLIRGLLKRKEWAKAELFWRRLARLCVGGGRAGGRANADELLAASDEVGTENEKGRVNMQGPTYIRHRRMVMDNAALCAGLQALIRGGKPHRAIKVLEKYAWKPGVSPVRQDAEIANLGRDRDSSSTPTASSSSSPSPPSSTQKITPPPIRLTPITLSELLVSFKRISRPDIVLFLFTHMATLYGVQPNEGCLNVMMQSARMGEGMDDCVQGVVERMKVRVGWGSGSSPISSSLAPSSTASATSVASASSSARGTADTSTSAAQTRAALVSRLYALTGAPTQKHPAPYKSCTQLVYPYRGAGPAEYARGVFLEAVWGGAWSGGYALMAAGGGDGIDNYAGSGNASGKGGTGNGKGKDKEEGQRVATEGLRGIDLSEVKAPARAVREDEGGETSLRSLWSGKEREWVPPRGVCLRPPAVTSFPASSSFATATSSPSNNPSSPQTFSQTATIRQLPPSSYPSLLPTTHSFSSYLALLATSGPAADVALVFGWMKRLGIQPDDECLGIGMAVWEGVSCGGVLVERWGVGSGSSLSSPSCKCSMNENASKRKGGTKKSASDDGTQKRQTQIQMEQDTIHGKEYHHLTAFLSSWLGPKRVPGEKEMRKWRDVVRRMRERVRRREG